PPEPKIPNLHHDTPSARHQRTPSTAGGRRSPAPIAKYRTRTHIVSSAPDQAHPGAVVAPCGM
ncbi:MAG: hypothetical protein U9N84_05880, partial [Actinomycetota bacterium]|nr:hypothetical protein [Actinomycetota bacterium]